MRKSNHIIAILYFGTLFWFCFAVPVHAYIDPATTAMITQVVAGVFISLGVVFGLFRRKIILFFKNMNVKRMQKKIEKDNQKE